MAEEHEIYSAPGVRESPQLPQPLAQPPVPAQQQPQSGRPAALATDSKLLTCLGGGLMVLALLFPFVTVSTRLLGESKDFMGYESDLLISAGIGAGLFILGLVHRPAPGKIFSPLGAITALVGMWVAIGVFRGNWVGRVPSPAVFQITLTTGPAALIAFVGSVISVTGCIIKSPQAPIQASG